VGACASALRKLLWCAEHSHQNAISSACRPRASRRLRDAGIAAKIAQIQFLPVRAAARHRNASKAGRSVTRRMSEDPART